MILIFQKISRTLSRRKASLTKSYLPTETPPAEGECEMVPVVREFRRPIAYDVDYVYRGTKYRSRLPYDPGNRLRVRVSVVPYVPPRKP